MQWRDRRTAGWFIAALTLTLLATVPLSLSGGVMQRPGVVAEGADAWVVPAVVSFALAGAALVQLRPHIVIGWLLLASALLQVTNVAANAYATRALTDPDGSLPLGLAAAWLASWTWLPSLLLPVVVLPALYPSGRPVSRFWAWHVRVALVGILLASAAMAFAPGGMDDSVRGVELAWTTPGWLLTVVGVAAALLLAATAGTTLVGTLVRVVRAGSPERQLLLWLLMVVTAMLVTVMTPYRAAFALSYALVPWAVVIGVLRYRLLGIEVVLRRTLLVVPLTLLVALVVGGLTTLLARLVPDGPLPLLAASAVVAVLVIPVAARLRVLVDRFVRGERVDPLSVVGETGAGLEAAQDDPVAAMLGAVASTSGVCFAAVTDEDGQELAAVGEARGPSLEVPLRHGGLALGTLRVGPRRGTDRLSEEDARLLTALAPHLAVVVRSQRLTDELARERERVTAATLAERDRLRRDLHDGLGPSLSGIALGLEAAAAALPVDTAAASELVARTRAEADAAVAEVRRVLDGLRPAPLDLHGLAGAVRDLGSSLGMGRPGWPALELAARPTGPLPPAVEEAAYRIVAESLTNVVRHADAGRCVVELARVNGDLQLAVSDDGLGFEPGPTAGHGLESMRQRANDLGGRLEIAPAQPHGTAVRATLPLGGAR